MKKYLNGKTCFLVTHDIDEAILMSDYIKIMNKNPAEILKDVSVNEIDSKFVEDFKNGIL